MITINVLELGASSLLDFDFNDKSTFKSDSKFIVTKSKNTKIPEVFDKLVLLNTLRSSDLTLRQELHDKDAVIFSVGNKGIREEFAEYDPAHVLNIIKTNFTLNAEFLSRVINIVKPRVKKIKLIYLGSISAAENAIYPNHAVYAAMKSAMKSLWATVKEECSSYPNIEFIYLELPQIKSRMASEGEDPVRFRQELITLLGK